MSSDPKLSGLFSVFAMMCIATIIANCLAMLIFNCEFLTFAACLYVSWKIAWKLLDWSVFKFLRN